MSEERLPMKLAADAPSVRTKSKGRSKGKRALPPQAVRGKLRLKPKVAKGKERGKNKDKAPKQREIVVQSAADRKGESRPEQTGLKRPVQPAEGYVRLRVRVADGTMSVLGSQMVDSTLLEPDAIHGNFAYEVSEGDHRLHVDSIPDLGVIRGFVNPDGPLEERQHHTYQQSVYEFDVRVPAKQLASAALPRVAIAFYRVKEQRPHMTLTARPLGVEYEREMREVARLDGIPAEALPPSLRKSRRASARTESKRKQRER